MHQIATIINFCSNEYRFLKSCIQEAQKFSSIIHIAIADHFFDGKKEDPECIRAIASEFPTVKFFLYPFTTKPIFGKNKATHLWHNVSRLISWHFLPREIEYILFLDADEIADGTRFTEWLDYFPYRNYSFLKLSCYWYFREACYQAKSFETSPLLAQKKALTRKLIMQKDERTGMFLQGKGNKIEGILGNDHNPLFHHYSWVRTKEEMLRKVQSWGHKDDRDWQQLVQKEFASEFQGKDFVHGYEFLKVDPFIKIDFNAKPIHSKNAKNITEISFSELNKVLRSKFLFLFV